MPATVCSRGRAPRLALPPPNGNVRNPACRLPPFRPGRPHPEPNGGQNSTPEGVPALKSPARAAESPPMGRLRRTPPPAGGRHDDLSPALMDERGRATAARTAGAVDGVGAERAVPRDRPRHGRAPARPRGARPGAGRLARRAVLRRPADRVRRQRRPHAARAARAACRCCCSCRRRWCRCWWRPRTCSSACRASSPAGARRSGPSSRSPTRGSASPRPCCSPPSGCPGPSPCRRLVLLAALASQFLVDFGVSAVRLRVGLGVEVRPELVVLRLDLPRRRAAHPGRRCSRPRPAATSRVAVAAVLRARGAARRLRARAARAASTPRSSCTG